VLIFFLMRPDVLPLGDIGLINSAFNLYQWEDPGTPALRREHVARAGEDWKPYRTVATWYIWRALDATPVIY
jgi:DNA-3-methyladenine glycosylase II